MTRKRAANIAAAWVALFLTMFLAVVLGAVGVLGFVALAFWQLVAGGDVLPPLLWALGLAIGTLILINRTAAVYNRFDRARKAWERKVEAGE